MGLHVFSLLVYFNMSFFSAFFSDEVFLLSVATPASHLLFPTHDFFIKLFTPRHSMFIISDSR